jgi:polar amino acid transport system ATP-binding protein
LPDLAITDLAAAYGGRRVLDGVTLRVGTGDVVGIVGPSGSGKSTLLRVLIGLLPPVAGQVVLDGTPVDYRRRPDVRALRDRLAIVFQQYNLFQNMTALGNVMIAPVRIKGRPKAEVRAEAEALLRRVGLGERLRAYPDELSGGQQQRVAIARALALRPEILLLDEVTSALDPELVGDVLEVIQGLTADGMTMLIVSHEMSFIRDVATDVVMMADGRIVETGAPAEFFRNPRSERARAFISRIRWHHDQDGRPIDEASPR